MSQTEVQLIKDAVIVNADISNSAAIDVSKISGALPAAGGTITGDVTFDGETAGRDIIFDRSANALEFADNAKAMFGSGDDLQIYHDGSNSFIKEDGTGNLYIFSANLRIENADGSKSYIEANDGGATELYHNGSKKVETTSTGATVTGNLLATGVFQNDTGGEGLHNTSTGAKFFSNNSNDTHLEHGSNAQVKLSFIGTGSTYRGAVNADANGMMLLTGASGEEKGINCIANGATELYHDNTKKLQTTANGIELPSNQSLFLGGKIDMTDSASTSTGRILLGTGDDLSIYHDGTNSVIDNITGELQIATDAVMRFQATEYKFNNAANTEKVANFFQDGACELYFNHSKKFETLTDGVNITGTLKVNGSAFSGGLASLVEDTSTQLGGNLDTNSHEIRLDDDHAVTFGDSNELAIQHISSGYSHISDSTNLRISSSEIRFRDGGNSNTSFFVDADGATQLYHNHTARFVTSTVGVALVQGGDKLSWPASSGAGPEV